MATGLEEEKLWIQTCCTPLKNWPCVTSCSYGGVGKYILNQMTPCMKSSLKVIVYDKDNNLDMEAMYVITAPHFRNFDRYYFNCFVNPVILQTTKRSNLQLWYWI